MQTSHIRNRLSGGPQCPGPHRYDAASGVEFRIFQCDVGLMSAWVFAQRRLRKPLARTD
jgi:hypothetical protein